ncbi:MAG: hypothetical protein EOP06_03390 [Proteobacteria bacterium]|nr:MAG: hypothetical protein EOP06_03390 [Pseudomonadota bacterium]
MRLLLMVLFSLVSTAHADSCKKLPARFEDNRIYLEVRTSDKKLLKFYTDTGGGLHPFIYNDTAAKLGLKAERETREEALTVGYTTLPNALFVHQGIPIDESLKGKTRIFAFNKKGEDEPSQIRFMVGDGFLGASFFADKIWKFDYLKRELFSCSAFSPVRFSATPMTFKTTLGTRDTHQPRIEVEIEGEKFPVLFDTGATSLYSPTAVKALSPQNAFTASSFIRESIAKRWLQSHPNWKIIKAGEKFAGGGDLIEVPLVSLAGHKVGPIWFATRRDDIYDRYSKDIMDSSIAGAVGGNLFRFFTMIADYPGSKLLVKTADR